MNVFGSSYPYVQVSEVFHQLQPLHMQPQPLFQAFQPNTPFGTTQPWQPLSGLKRSLHAWMEYLRD